MGLKRLAGAELTRRDGVPGARSEKWSAWDWQTRRVQGPRDRPLHSQPDTQHLGTRSPGCRLSGLLGSCPVVWLFKINDKGITN